MRQLLLWENRRMKAIASDHPDLIWMTTEANMKFEVDFEGERCLLNGAADYAIWYADGKMNTNLIVVEAKREGKLSSGIAQCLAYAG
jgi:hypothetical protein